MVPGSNYWGPYVQTVTFQLDLRRSAGRLCQRAAAEAARHYRIDDE